MLEGWKNVIDKVWLNSAEIIVSVSPVVDNIYVGADYL